MRAASAGDYDYERGGAFYAAHRRADVRIAALIHAALGGARTLINVGAGSGSYEPTDRAVFAIEPSHTMRAQRPSHLSPAIDATAESLPFDDGVFEAALASVTVHQWTDPASGLSELRRVTRGPIVILTFDGDVLGDFWLADYVPELIEAERRRYPPIDWIGAKLGGEVSVEPVPVPFDCTDGFTEAFYGRPEQFLSDDVRRAQSAWAFVSPDVEARFVHRLNEDLASGEWDRRHGHLRQAPVFLGSLRLIVAHPC